MESVGDGDNPLDPSKGNRVYSGTCGPSQLLAHVEGSAKIIIEPDMVEFLFSVESVKDKADDAKQSVTKRIDYLLQIIRNANMKGEINISTNRMLMRIGQQFCLVGEVLVQCEAVQKYEEITNVIVEKLESGVKISEPHFFHSPKSILEGRQLALKMAVCSARSKAQDIASTSCQFAGRALVVEEKENSISRVKQLPTSLRESISKKRFVHALEILSHIIAVYELISENKEKNN